MECGGGERFDCFQPGLQTYMVLQRLCDSSIFEADMPLDICAQLREESRTQLRVRLADMCLAVLRRMGMSRLARPLLVLREQSLLQATEALGEYATALEAASAQIGPAQTLAEISSELRHIHLYLWGRELECPAMYYAQLTHRAALSMLGKRMAVVSNLADQGLLDDQEHKVIHRPLRERLHSLRRTGVQVHIPIPREMMSSLPFLKCLPQEERNAILGKVTTTTFGPGTVVMGTTSGPGLHAPMEPAGCSPAKACPANETEIQMLMVGDGLLETACEDADEKTYWGRGGVIGLLPTLIASAPGAKPRETGVNGKLRAVVVPVDIHNRLTPDALVLGLPLEVFRDIRQRSANGDKRMKLAELNAFRLAAIAELHLPEHKSVVLHELRRRAEQRLTSASPGVRSLPHPATEAIAQGTAPGDIDPDALAMDRAVEQKAQGQFADVLSAITTSLLVEVPPGGMIVSDYPVLVLGGHVSRHAPFAGAEGPGARPDIKPPNHRRPPSIAPGKDALAPAISFIQEEELQAFGVAFPPDLHGDTRVAPQGMPTQSTLQGACQKLIAGGNSGATVLLLSAPSGDPAM